MIDPALRNLYTKIFCQATSPEESLLCIGNSEGKLILFDITKLLPQEENASREKLSRSKSVVSASNDSIYSMTSSKDFCITGATGVISGWNWKELKEGNAKVSWNIHLECDQSNFGTPEVNNLAYDNERQWIFAACGDWKTRGYDLETGKETLNLSGHDDYVHDVVLSGNQVISAGEDGQILLWDSRVGREPKLKLKPSSQPSLKRPHFGSYISSVDVENDWLICGGGPRAGIFHLRSLALTSVFEPKETIVNVTKFARQGFERGGIVVAGSEPTVYVCNISGEVTAEIPTSSPCVYTVHIMEPPYSVVFIGGSGPELDVCLNLNYRDHSVYLTEDH